MPSDEQIIDDALSNPQSAAQDGRSASAHSLPDQIEAIKFKRSLKRVDATSTTAKRTGWGGVIKSKVEPPGAV